MFGVVKAEYARLRSIERFGDHHRKLLTEAEALWTQLHDGREHYVSAADTNEIGAIVEALLALKGKTEAADLAATTGHRLPG
jgi:hypothetical protein